TSPWTRQHAEAVTKTGIDKCFTACHKQKFCLDCHTKTKPFPTSHKAGTWLHRANKDPFAGDKALHAKNAVASPAACEICHGVGGTKSKFCQSCHKYDMPHADNFKKFHGQTGRKNIKQCGFCHQFKETCSNCHHKGSSVKVSWIKLHGGQVAKEGGESCLAKCHKQDFCVGCHTKRAVLPVSHKAKGWTRRAELTKPAGHPAAFKTSATQCGYCHGSSDVNANRFCKGCHKTDMPHASGFGAKGEGGAHAADFKAKKLTKAQCVNCHATAFCNGCHHEYTGSKPWLKQHPGVVKTGDPATCFAKCHKETFCSYCHVRLGR
ncbi:MAG: hypothetical protein Q7W30_06965, partial [Coriobacteriia bacterium]|nr:hypothetical protein [Coriobacteriia bacterium]